MSDTNDQQEKPPEKLIHCDLCYQYKPESEMKRLTRGKYNGFVCHVDLCKECRKPVKIKKKD